MLAESAHEERPPPQRSRAHLSLATGSSLLPAASAREQPLPQLKAEGRIFTRNWTLYDGFHVVFWPKHMTPYELQEAMMEANRRFYTAGRISAIGSTAPVYRKHRIQGYLLSRAWEHVRENRDFLGELKDLSESSAPPVSVAPRRVEDSRKTGEPALGRL